MRRFFSVVAASFAVLSAHSMPASAERGDAVRSLPSPGDTPTGLAFDGNLLWVSDHKSGALSGIDPKTGALARTIEAPSFRTTGLAFDGRYLWTVDGARRMAYRLDPKTGKSDHRVELEAAGPGGLAFYRGSIVVSDDRRGLIHEVDLSDGTTLRTIPAPSRGVTGIAFVGDVLYAANRLEDRIYALDYASGNVYFHFDAPGPHSTGLALVNGLLAVSDYQDDSISFLDLSMVRPYRVIGGRRLNMEFTFTLRNAGPDPLETADVYVAIPRSRAYQELHGEPVFEPAPGGVVTEAGGQEVASFRFADVKAGGEVRVMMRVDATLRTIRYHLLPNEAGSLEALPGNLKKLYTRDGSKLRIRDPSIREAAASLARGGPDLLTLVRRSYDFVIDRMSYDLTGGWNAAPMILRRGTGSCSEYSFLLMALLRANGVPARYAGSLVVRGDDASWDDVFHRWVEVYLPAVGWFPLDANKGDKATPAQRASGFGQLDDKVLVTTESPGGTLRLGWTYGYETRHTCAGKCSVEVDAVAEWSPSATEQASHADELPWETTGECR